MDRTEDSAGGAPSARLDGVTALIERLRRGDVAAREELYAGAFEDLRRYAHRLLPGRGGDTLQPTALVGEAWLRVVAQGGGIEVWDDRKHFFGTLARAMRHVVIDHERARQASRRSPLGERVELEDVHAAYRERGHDLLALDEALEALARRAPELVEVVELRFFLGCSRRETASLQGVSERTVERRFAEAREWLFQRIEGTAPAGP